MSVTSRLFPAVIAVALIGGFVTLRNGAVGTLNVIDRVMGHRSTFIHRADIPFGTHGQALDIWKPAVTPGPRPVLIFYYGGGWVKGTRQEYGWAARAYASKGFVVVLPDYRKVPGVAFPAFVEDAAQAVKWTRDNVARYGGDPNRIAIAGHSAGAYAVAMLALDPRWLTAQGLPRDTIKAAVGLSGPYDFLPFTGRAIAALGKWPRPAETQPISFARADAPPMMLVTGTKDTEVRPKNARNLALRLQNAGAVVTEQEYPGLGHEDIAMALSVPFRSKAPVLDDSVSFIRAMLARSAGTEASRQAAFGQSPFHVQ